MKFYHGTSLESWHAIQAEGVLWGQRNLPSRCTAQQYGEVVLEVDYEPKSLTDNWTEDCWQVRVYAPLTMFQRIR